MPIDRANKQAFIHIPKCGGTSIEARYNLHRKECFFEGKYDAYTFNDVTYAPQHLTPTLLSQLVPEWDQYNTFCFVRDPIEKLVSEYFQLHTHYYQKPKRFFNERAFRFWLKTEAAQFRMDHTLPQWEYAKDCQHIFSLSNLNKTIPTIDKWFGLKNASPIEHKKRGGKHWTIRGKKSNKDISSTLSSSTKKLITEIYQIDFDNLNQHF